MRKSTRKPFKKMSRRKLRFLDIKVCGDKLHVNAIHYLKINLRGVARKQIYNFELSLRIWNSLTVPKKNPAR